MELLTSPEAWIALITLTALEIVLGIDNIVFISIMAGKLPPEQRERAQRDRPRRGDGHAHRAALLDLDHRRPDRSRCSRSRFSTIEVSGRDLILLGGGLFLIAKATFEIHERLEGEEATPRPAEGDDAGQRDHSDHAARHRLLDRLGHHRGRHVPRPSGHGRRDRHRRGRDARSLSEPIGGSSTPSRASRSSP